MRIGIVCPYSLDVPGGVQNHVRDLATVLLSRGHQVRLLAPGRTAAQHPPHVTTVGPGVPTRYNGAVGRVAFGPRVSAQTRRWLHDGDFDVLHLHEPEAPSVSLLALWQSRTTVVATFHTATSRSAVLAAAGALLRPSLGKIAARIAVSDSARETLVHHLGGRTPAVIANGIFCDRFASAIALPEWTSPAPTIAFLGRTDEPRKGLALLLKAFGEVLSAYPTARLLVAGYGRAAAVRRLPEHVRRQVEVLGQLSDGDRARLLASATVFVAPQLGGESFGVVLAEAMAAGAPVVASDLPAFRSMLDGSRLGELFAVGDAQGAADAICRVLGSTARRLRLRRRAAAAVRRYDWSDVVPEIEAVYESVAPVRTTGRAP